MRIVILGCGRVGARLASTLDREGHEVSIIDKNTDAFRRLDPEFRGQALVGNGIDEEVLRRAGIEQAQIFAAVTDDDNTNVMACQIAKYIFHVPKVIARLYDPVREETYHMLGLETVCPTTECAYQIKRLLDARWRQQVASGASSRPEEG